LETSCYFFSSAPIYFLQDGKAQLEWMATSAWNTAQGAAQAGQLQTAAVLFGISGQFYEAHPSPDKATLQRQKVSFMMAGSAALDVHEDENAPDQEDALALAASYLLSSRKACEALLCQMARGSTGVEEEARSEAFLILLVRMTAACILFSAQSLGRELIT
jgi:hypothetical protein